MTGTEAVLPVKSPGDGDPTDVNTSPDFWVDVNLVMNSYQLALNE
jgi:hypothetical protein